MVLRWKYISQQQPLLKHHRQSQILPYHHSEENQLQQSQRLQLSNSLFGQEQKNPCEKTGIHHESSLNYLLHTFLHLGDTAWVLSMITIDNDEMIKINQTLGQNVINKINQIGTVIKNFTDNDQRKLKGFTLNYKDKSINSINNINDIYYG